MIELWSIKGSLTYCILESKGLEAMGNGMIIKVLGVQTTSRPTS